MRKFVTAFLQNGSSNLDRNRHRCRNNLQEHLCYLLMFFINSAWKQSRKKPCQGYIKTVAVLHLILSLLKTYGTLKLNPFISPRSPEGVFY